MGSLNPEVPGGASVAVSWTFLPGFFLSAEMVGTCLDPTLWSDKTPDQAEPTAWCERGNQEQLTQCALPPCPKDTVFTQIARVAPQVYLPAATALVPSALEGLALTLVINTTTELPILPLERAVGVRVPLLDSPSEDLLPHLSQVCRLISNEVESGGTVLVHCVAGVSRSASFVLAYLISTYNLTLNEALCHLKLVRPWVNPNKGFLSQLRTWEDEYLTSKRH